MEGNFSSSSESSSEDDENTKLIKEAAQCDYVNKLYSNSYNDNCIDRPKKKIKSDSESKENTISSHQVFLAKRLNERLDNLIEVIETPASTAKNPSSLASKGIRLLNDSVCIDEVQDDIIINKCPIESNVLTYKEHVARAKEVAVTCDWVLSRANTSLWSTNKKPKIINLKVTNKLTEEKLECDIVSKINIPDKFRLI